MILILTSCTQYVKYTPDPERDVGKWISNFANQRSFSYYYSVKTLAIYTEAHGECLIGIGEHVTGLWQGNDQEIDFEYYGFFDHEYEKQNGRWVEAARGEQTDIFVQIERVLEFDKFEYQPDKDKYTYHFKANAAFLSPVHRKEMVGVIKFSSKDYRPLEIWAGLPDSSIYWTIELARHNRLKSIKPPIMKWQKHDVGKIEYFKEVKRRLSLLDIPFRIKRGNQKLNIEVPAYVSKDELQKYFSNTEITVSEVVDDRAQAKRVLDIDGKKTTVFVGNALFGNSDIKDCQVRLDAIGRPFLMLKLKNSMNIARRILVELSEQTPQIVNIDKDGKMSKINMYLDKTFHDMLVIRAQVLQPLYDIKTDF